MKYKSFVISIILLAVLFIAGCKDDKDTKDSSPKDPPESEVVSGVEDEEAEEENDNQSKNQNTADLNFLGEVDDVPQKTNDVIQQVVGPYAGIDVRDDSVIDQVVEEVKKIEPLPEDATEEQLQSYFNYLYSLVAEDFPDPQDTIKKWEFGSFGNPDLPDSRFHFKENYNVEVLLDGSGSMGAYIGNQTMMEIAKEAIHNFMKQVPEEANVSLRVYGHKGTGSESDKELSCSTIEQVYGYAPYDEQSFKKELDAISPAGWTPLADALKQAQRALAEYDTENNTNLIYVVSDGIETCDGDPVAVAKSLSDSNAKPIINIIGFNVDSEAQAQLKEMAEVSGGIFSMANDQSELEDEFNRAEEVLEAWKDWKDEALDDVDSIRVDNNFDILRVSNEWGRKETRQSNNISRLARIFEDESIITFEQREYLRDLRDEVHIIIEDGQDEIVKELEGISAEKLDEIKQSINEKYNQGTE
ncbi:VWA domain-containing protein [Ornithinibacillus xuwenensis]|uniref:VWA domain-containing protein n=1 Tax=Ornithinibacillus xuwenensis TaxID=3144668 RepID=A0ABU9XGW6_9BACI